MRQNDIANHVGQFDRWQAGKNGPSEALDLPFLSEEPADQAAGTAQFMTDYRGAQGHGMRVIDFTQQFAATVEIVGIGKIGFPVTALLAGKHAIRTDMHQAGTGGAAQRRQAMRQKRIERNRLQGIVRIGQLLDQSDAIHDHLGTHPGKSPNDGILLFDINAGDEIIPQGALKMSPRRFAASGAMHRMGG